MAITVQSIEKVDDNTLLVVADVGGLLPLGEPDTQHSIYIPIDAIGSRMVMYGLDTPGEALDALLREHHALSDPSIETPKTMEQALATYQELKNVPVVGAEKERLAVISDDESRILDASAQRAAARQTGMR